MGPSSFKQQNERTEAIKTTPKQFMLTKYKIWFARGRYTFLGAFPKLRIETLSFVLSVGWSVRMEQLDSHWTDFH